MSTPAHLAPAVLWRIVVLSPSVRPLPLAAEESPYTMAADWEYPCFVGTQHNSTPFCVAAVLRGLGGNSLSGSIPTEIGNLVSLSYL